MSKKPMKTERSRWNTTEIAAKVGVGVDTIRKWYNYHEIVGFPSEANLPTLPPMIVDKEGYGGRSFKWEKREEYIDQLKKFKEAIGEGRSVGAMNSLRTVKEMKEYVEKNGRNK